MYDDNITHYRKHQHTITLIVSNEPGMLARVAGLFMRRNFNIEALTVAQSTKPEISRMTISFKGDDKVYEQLAKQLNKEVNIVKVSDLPPDISIIRELALIKIHTKGPEEQKQLMAYCQAHEAKVAHEPGRHDCGDRWIAAQDRLVPGTGEAHGHQGACADRSHRPFPREHRLREALTITHQSHSPTRGSPGEEAASQYDTVTSAPSGARASPMPS